MPSSDYGHYEERVVHDERDRLYGGTRRFVATLGHEASSEPGLPPSPEPPEIELASAPEPEPEPTINQSAPPSLPPGNGSREAWAAYAASLGLTVTDDLARNEIRALVDEHMKES